MADPWDEYLRRQQPTRTTGAGLSGLFGSLFGGQPGSGSTGGLQPNKQGMYTPSLMSSGAMQPGPPTPINYGAIRGLLNSGVLRTGTVAPPPPMPAPAPEPEAPAQSEHPLARMFSLFGGLRT
jgi:hypothetical protein